MKTVILGESSRPPCPIYTSRRLPFSPVSTVRMLWAFERSSKYCVWTVRLVAKVRFPSLLSPADEAKIWRLTEHWQNKKAENSSTTRETSWQCKKKTNQIHLASKKQACSSESKHRKWVVNGTMNKTAILGGETESGLWSLDVTSQSEEGLWSQNAHPVAPFSKRSSQRTPQ